ncbi:hypothetical protein PROFUN_00625 [Planoprotostelium fungivorum]|uniref:Uncharacterized protein n=1 Tax=Planoprotostelium fungivorum TaxID=1890364 RepID=A0A2P6NTX6_9EUKA|nr:hypothetical protein PROFUN_00625 [Planoprotostelium fungivorum]
MNNETKTQMITPWDHIESPYGPSVTFPSASKLRMGPGDKLNVLTI